jgi:hypothetical protein
MDAERTDHGRAPVAMVVALVVAAALLTAPAALALPRATADRVDDNTTPNQVHVIYALPSDGTDAALDTGGTLEGSVGVWQNWLRGQTGGKGLTLDTFGGALDITFARLPRTDAQYRSFNLFIRDEIETDLRGMGLLVPRKLYAVYYDGTANGVCGGAPWPQSEAAVAGTGQQVAAFYLHGDVPDPAPDCDTNPFAGPGDPPAYTEFAQLHELIHGLGVVPTCAPHHTLAGHVSDSNNDLMYAGGQPWLPTTLDVGRDDYFNAPVSGCLDLADSKYLEGNGDPPPKGPSAVPETEKGKGPTGKLSGRKATFRFSSETAESFECHLDRASWEACTSPHREKKLKPGKHEFFARGLDAEGNPDETPALWKFKVTRP